MEFDDVFILMVWLSVVALFVLLDFAVEYVGDLAATTRTAPTLAELLAMLSLLQLSEEEFKTCKRAIKRMTPAQQKELLLKAYGQEGLSMQPGDNPALLSYRLARAKYHVLRMCGCFKEAKRAVSKLRNASIKVLALDMRCRICMGDTLLRRALLIDASILFPVILLGAPYVVVLHFNPAKGHALCHGPLGYLGVLFTLNNASGCSHPWIGCFVSSVVLVLLETPLRWAWLCWQERTSAAALPACQDASTQTQTHEDAAITDDSACSCSCTAAELQAKVAEWLASEEPSTA